jgi:hypothetical protein
MVLGTSLAVLSCINSIWFPSYHYRGVPHAVSARSPEHGNRLTARRRVQ